MTDSTGQDTTTRTLSDTDFAVGTDDRYFEDYVAGAVYEYGYASVLAVVLGAIGIGIALGLVRFSGFASMRSQQAGAT